MTLHKTWPAYPKYFWNLLCHKIQYTYSPSNTWRQYISRCLYFYMWSITFIIQGESLKTLIKFRWIERTRNSHPVFLNVLTYETIFMPRKTHFPRTLHFKNNAKIKLTFTIKASGYLQRCFNIHSWCTPIK